MDVISLEIVLQVAPEQEEGVDAAPVRGEQQQAQERGHGGGPARRETQLEPLRGRTGE